MSKVRVVRRRRLLVACMSALVMGYPVRACALGATDWPTLKRAIRSRYPEVRQISTEELRAAFSRAAPPLLIDARTVAEYRVSHLHGARRAETASEAMKALTHAPKDGAIVVYCSVGYRSAALARELMRLGYTRVTNLEGSIFEWANKGFPVYRGSEPASVVHPYDRTWGIFLDRELWASEHLQ